jgi:hypothetical protein
MVRHAGQHRTVCHPRLTARSGRRRPRRQCGCRASGRGGSTGQP